MSTQNIIDSNNLPGDNLIYQAITGAGEDLIKSVRYGVGEVCHKKLRHILRLERLHCEPNCSITDEQKRNIREDLIETSIRELQEL